MGCLDIHNKKNITLSNIELKEIKVTHERFSIDGSAEDPSKAKNPPDHDNEKPEEEDVVNIHGVHTKIMLEGKLG